MDAARSEEARGRPPLKSNEEILDAALDAFATFGYDSMSLRSLNRDLGLSNGTINQRFGSKEQLFIASIDQGFGALYTDIQNIRAARPTPTDDVEVRRERIRAFLIASSRRPQLVRLMNSEGISPSERLDHVFTKFIEPAITDPDDSMRLAATREWFFIVVHGAAAPFTLHALSSKFDDHGGPLDVEAYADRMSALLAPALDFFPPELTPDNTDGESP